MHRIHFRDPRRRDMILHIISSNLVLPGASSNFNDSVMPSYDPGLRDVMPPPPSTYDMHMVTELSPKTFKPVEGQLAAANFAMSTNIARNPLPSQQATIHVEIMANL